VGRSVLWSAKMCQIQDLGPVWQFKSLQRSLMWRGEVALQKSWLPAVGLEVIMISLQWKQKAGSELLFISADLLTLGDNLQDQICCQTAKTF
jgi:hypothetical protein